MLQFCLFLCFKYGIESINTMYKKAFTLCLGIAYEWAKLIRHILVYNLYFLSFDAIWLNDYQVSKRFKVKDMLCEKYVLFDNSSQN